MITEVNATEWVFYLMTCHIHTLQYGNVYRMGILFNDLSYSYTTVWQCLT